MMRRINPVRAAMFALALTMLTACHHAEPAGSASSADCLPSLSLTDQNAQSVNLASLKGHAVLFDFIYTSCPGPCEMMTQRMAKVADKLGSDFGNKVSFVSVTIDPEHD